VNNVRFVIVDNESCVESISDLNPVPGHLANGSSIYLTVNYKTTLNEANSTPLIRGRDRNTAATGVIYVIYNDGSKDVSVPLTVKIQDCNCCGAKVSPTEWVPFMCHNLGADQSADPFTPAMELIGSSYQWGRATSVDITPNGNTYPPNFSWLDASKTATDPCPPGWRVPTGEQLENMLKSNTLTYVGDWNYSLTNYSAGVMVGPDLYFPAAFKLNDEKRGLYWGSKWSGLTYPDGSPRSSYGSAIDFRPPHLGIVYEFATDTRLAINVRCVSSVAQFSTSTYDFTKNIDLADRGYIIGTADGPYNYDSPISVTAYENTGCFFFGWYNGTTLLTRDRTYDTTMPERSLAIEARFTPPTTLGSGDFKGRILFDIAETEGGNGCGELAVRAATKADFTSLSPADKTYTYTATTDNVNNVRFVIFDEEGCVTSTSDLNPVPGHLTNGSSAILTVDYKTTLNEANSTPRILGRDRSAAAIVMIYVVYYDGSKDVSIPLTVRIQDCKTCGAYLGAVQWVPFMCHNLGADQNADPFTPAKELNGDYYQWGHLNAAATVETPQGSVGGWNTIKAPDNSWSYTSKTDNDPCPPGWRVPARYQWEAIKNNNTHTPVGNWSAGGDPTNFSAGLMVGSDLYLPAAGVRGANNGLLSNRGFRGEYWSSKYGSCFYFGEFSVVGDSPVNDTSGLSIRCILE
jgi:hypothetical protein